jgi:hypothetical protein
MDDDRFSLWLSMAARDRSVRTRMAPELGRAGFWNRAGRHSNFLGVKFGRGAGVGRVLASSMPRNGFIRRVLTRTRIVRVSRGYNSTAVETHLRYLVRSRADAGRQLTLYGADGARDAAEFARACREDRHQFRMVVAAADACEYEDLRPLIQRTMMQAARDLRTRLDWVAADHFDTANPHTHVVIRGVDDHGYDLVIAREYINHGFRARAAELIALDLGPTLEVGSNASKNRRLDIMLERVTAIDRDILAMRDGQGRVTSDHPDRWEQAARAGRLHVLATMGLAHAEHDGRWFVQPNLIQRLEQIERRNRMERSRDRAVSTELAPVEGKNGDRAKREKNTDDRSYAGGSQQMSDYSIFEISGNPNLCHLESVYKLSPCMLGLPRLSLGFKSSVSRSTMDPQDRGDQLIGLDRAAKSERAGDGRAASVGQTIQLGLGAPERRHDTE